MSNNQSTILLLNAWALIMSNLAWADMNVKNLTCASSGLISWWTGNGNVEDSVNMNDGTLENGVTFATGKAGQGFNLHGATNYVAIPNVIQSWSQGSIESWVKYTDSNYGMSGTWIFSTTTNAPADVMGLGIHSDIGSEMVFGIYPESWQFAKSGITPIAEQWYHVVGTWGSTGIKIYIDGVLKGGNSYTGAAKSSNNNRIGAGSWPNSSINAVIDELKIYNCALNANEIANLIYPLTINKTGTGSGTVIGNLSGINCGADCVENYVPRTQVTLTATPASGFMFGGWNGAGCSGTAANCTVTVNAATTVTAIFNRITYPLTILKAGTGSGTVLSNPVGISCGIDCSEDYAPNTVVTLVAGTTGNSSFSGWSGGGCVGNGTCTFNMNAAKTVTATFSLLSQSDFTVTGITLAPNFPVANSTFNAAVTVKNSSTVAGNGGILRLWANQAGIPTCAATGGDKAVVVGVLAAGASKILNVTGINAGAGGIKTLRAFVDAACSVAESNETNNQRTLSYRVTGRKADFIITALTLNPTVPTANGSFIALVTVKNQGNVAGLAGYLDVWANQATAQTCGAGGDAWADLGSLAAAAIKTVTVTVPAGVAGAKTLRAYVDSWCETLEVNDINNQRTQSYTVQ